MRLSSFLLALLAGPLAGAELLNVSYDVTREYYREINTAFSAQWQQAHGEPVTVNQSHGGSSKQARAVIDGLQADVVTMNQASDIDRIAAAKVLPKNWRERFPNQASPTTSTIIFVVRAGNPKGIQDWSDLVKPGISVIVPNPKTSGNGRYSYLAAWAFALRANGNDQAKARDFVKKLFANVPVFDTGGRGATTTFAQRGIGDVLLTFESEVGLITKDVGGAGLQAVIPSLSIKAENPVAVVDKYATKHGNEALAKAYLDFLYSPAGQEIALKHHLRPIDPALLEREKARFERPLLVTAEEAVGGWDKAFTVHFNDGALFDQITTK
jgi:sulfate transport system substrate-binding protein